MLFWGGARDQKEYAFQRTCNIKTNLINHKLVSTILEMSSGQPAHIINSFLKTFYSTLLNILPNSLSIQILLHCCWRSKPQVHFSERKWRKKTLEGIFYLIKLLNQWFSTSIAPFLPWTVWKCVGPYWHLVGRARNAKHPAVAGPATEQSAQKGTNTLIEQSMS